MMRGREMLLVFLLVFETWRERTGSTVSFVPRRVHLGQEASKSTRVGIIWGETGSVVVLKGRLRAEGLVSVRPWTLCALIGPTSRSVGRQAHPRWVSTR